MYYKIVRKDLTSWVMNGENTGLQVQYKLGEWVSADEELVKEGYGLFVYEDLATAKLLALGDDRLFRVEVEEELPKTIKLFDPGQVNKQAIMDKKNDFPLNLPAGATIVKRVKLVEEDTSRRYVPNLRFL